MKKPRNFKQAREAGYVVIAGYHKYSKRMCVCVRKPYTPGLIYFWIDRNYFRRNYPLIYDSL